MSAQLMQATQGDGIDTEFQAGQASLARPVRNLFAALEEAHISYCLLRDGDQLQALAQSNEIDILVNERDFRRLSGKAAQHAFVRLRSWGHAPHHFFLTYDNETDRWLKLDVVTCLTYGRPVRALHTNLATGCLERRKQKEPVYIPSPEDEFINLLLHCVLDKAHFAPVRRNRLRQLRHEIVDHQYLADLLDRYWLPRMTWMQIARLIDDEDWPALLACETELVARLTDRDRLGTAFRQLRGRIFKRLNRWADFWRPRVPMVAVLAPDGAGKSTLAAGIEASSYFPVHAIYMGLYQNEKSRARYLKLPGLGLLSRILTQWRRYLAARYHQGRSRLVIFDRYTYDALLSSRHSLNGLRRFRRWLLANACPPPDLVIILDAPGPLLHARKGEHTAALLEKQRQEYLEMRSQLPRAEIIDASQDSDSVRREAMSLIWRQFQRQTATTGGSW